MKTLFIGGIAHGKVIDVFEPLPRIYSYRTKNIKNRHIDELQKVYIYYLCKITFKKCMHFFIYVYEGSKLSLNNEIIEVPK